MTTMAGKAKHPVIDGKKRCSECNENLPFDAVHFASQPDKKLGRRILSACKPCRNKASRAWAQTDHGRERHRVTQAESLKNPDNRAKHNATCNAYGTKNKVARAARSAAWKAAHPDATKAWRDANRPRLRVYENRAWAKRAKAPGSFTPDDLQAQFNAQGGACFYCTKPLTRFHIEHKAPLARGGTNYPDNIVCACARCNLRKGPRTAEEFFVILRGDAAKVA